MERYPLIHKPKQPIKQPQITTPVVGEGRFVRITGGYGHVILQLEPNSENDGCFMLWSVTPEFTRGKNPDYLLTTHFLDSVYQGLCEAIAEDEDHSSLISYVSFPYENTNIRIIGGSEHSVDSRSDCYRIAACLALKDAVAKVGMEPPEELSVTGDSLITSNEVVIKEPPKRYPLIHKPKKPVSSQPQLTAPVVGEGRYVLTTSPGGYGHVILQLEPNSENNGCFMLWSVPTNATQGTDAPLSDRFLDNVYWGLCKAIAESEDRRDWICYVPFPYENTNIRIIGGSERGMDSRAVYYSMAAYFALEDAVSKVLAITLEDKFSTPTAEPPLLFEPVVETPRYHALQNSLRQKKWRDADKLTKELIFELAGATYSERDETYWLYGGWTGIPNADLQLIDRLWTTYSRGRFGFSVQKQIFLDCGGTTGDRSEQQAWEQFNRQVGWQLEDDDPRKEIITLLRFKLPQNQVFHHLAPSGYFPCLHDWGYESVKRDLIQLFLMRELPQWIIQPYSSS